MLYNSLYDSQFRSEVSAWCVMCNVGPGLQCWLFWLMRRDSPGPPVTKRHHDVGLGMVMPGADNGGGNNQR